MKKYIALVSLVALAASLSAQNGGDQKTAGFNNQRTYLNTHMGDFGPAFGEATTISLAGVENARTFLPFGDFVAVGEIDGTTVTYHIFELDNSTAMPRLTTTVEGSAAELIYSPAYADNIILFGLANTVRAVQVTGTCPDMTPAPCQLWEDSSVGSTTGRYPILTNGLALYHGQSKLVAAEADTGIVFWEFDTTTAQAPIAMHSTQVFAFDSGGTLHGIDSSNGLTNWSAGFSPTDPVGWSLIGGEEQVFFADPTNETVAAHNANNGALVWAVALPGLSTTPGIALAYDQLFTFVTDNEGAAEVRAHNPDNGDVSWMATEDRSGLDYGLVANNAVYYYNAGRIRVRDAFTGVLLWTIPLADVRGLTASDGRLYALLADSIAVVDSSNAIFFPHVADGLGQSTLVTLSNLSSETASGTLSFFDTEGNPMSLGIEGMMGNLSTVPFTIAANGSRRIQTSNGDGLSVGWARVDADQDIRGSAIYQFSDAGVILFEAGISETKPTSEATVFVIFETRPGLDGPTRFSTGIAFANPLGETANVALSLQDESGAEVAMDTVVLTPGAQLARFFDELFPASFGDGDFEGALVITSDNPIIITSLRTLGGFQLSSLPAGQVR